MASSKSTAMPEATPDAVGVGLFFRRFSDRKHVLQTSRAQCEFCDRIHGNQYPRI